MNETIRLQHSFYGVEFQTIFAITPTDNGHRITCTVEEACDVNGRTIVEGVTVYHQDNVIESHFYVAEQSETDAFSKEKPFSKSDNAMALLKINGLSSLIVSAFFNISAVEVKELINDKNISFEDFIHKNIEHFI